MYCSACTAPWHPETGMMVGSPKSYPFCGRCWRESFACLKQYASRERFGGKKVIFYGTLPSSNLGG